MWGAPTSSSPSSSLVRTLWRLGFSVGLFECLDFGHDSSLPPPCLLLTEQRVANGAEERRAQDHLREPAPTAAYRLALLTLSLSAPLAALRTTVWCGGRHARGKAHPTHTQALLAWPQHFLYTQAHTRCICRLVTAQLLNTGYTACADQVVAACSPFPPPTLGGTPHTQSSPRAAAHPAGAVSGRSPVVGSDGGPWLSPGRAPRIHSDATLSGLQGVRVLGRRRGGGGCTSPRGELGGSCCAAG